MGERHYKVRVSSGGKHYRVKYVTAKVKPETVGRGTPGWEAQTVRPEPGCVFSSFEMAGMPEPTAEETVTENGRYPVARLGFLKVQVPQPAGEVELTENRDYDVSGYETAKVRVPQGVFPEGKLPVTKNGTYDVTGYETAEVNVPVEWVSPSGQARLVTQRVTLPEDFSGQATAFIPIITALAGIDTDHQDVVITTLAMAEEPQAPATNEVRELVIGYTAGLRYKRTYWNGSRWVTAIATNTYFNVVAKAGTVYELVGFMS